MVGSKYEPFACGVNLAVRKKIGKVPARGAPTDQKPDSLSSGQAALRCPALSEPGAKVPFHPAQALRERLWQGDAATIREHAGDEPGHGILDEAERGLRHCVNHPAHGGRGDEEAIR